MRNSSPRTYFYYQFGGKAHAGRCSPAYAQASQRTHHHRHHIARRLAIDWLPYPERSGLGVYALTERVQAASPWIESNGLSLCRTQTFG
jgi:hypothetical protein